MRIARLLAAILTLLTAGFLLATPASAQPPSKLTDHITDTTGVLTSSDRAAVSSAIDRLYRDRHLQLWVVYVDNFSRFKPENWADQTRAASKMGAQDALLAVAINTKLYAFSVPAMSASAVGNLRSTKIDPEVNAKDWGGAAVAAADGLNNTASSPARNWLPIAIGVVVAVVVLVVLVLLIRRRRRRRAATRGSSDVAGVNPGGRVESLAQALSIADARLRQISDYVARHRKAVGDDAKARLDDAKQYLAAAHGKKDEPEAIAYANRASVLAAQAQTLANADVLATHRAPRR
ncbi:TPM domain-containing protein [Mycobacterium vicinigordonae]|uniref:TPM domain-containing protein n=1 Tax=Mycobacterium vicinigordonae TaxID=1719132 RepID=A0A7D6DVK2_9MYCO|nr:TPM domain-containing protein [Mycobacterium vicinigordonae]QLL05728.1 TPM domain-containing protein [Mycobacterium vicinigordonae]